MQLLREVTGLESGWGAKIRFPQLHIEQLSEGKLNSPVLKSECSPLLLAIKASNSQAVKDLLENDQSLNLRESLRGPA